MLVEVEKNMRDVTLSATSYKEMKQIYMARDIYMPRKLKTLTSKEENEVYKRFFKGFSQTRDRPEVIEVLQEIE